MSENSHPPPAAPIPSPAQFAGRKAAVRPAVGSGGAASAQALTFGRVADDGTVYVRTAEGERAVGSYPGSSAGEALAYFARKYDDLASAAALLAQRLEQTDLSAREARDALKTLREHIGEANVVGDLASLEARVLAIEHAVRARSQQESQRRAQAKESAAQAREEVVAAAEKLAASDPARVQWKSASTRMRELFEQWKTQQQSGPRLDKGVEDALWHRFRAARSSFDTMRKTWFAHLDEEQGLARREKEKLVAQAEALATSKDWRSTAGEFKRLMERWRRTGRAPRSRDDELWHRFKAAQDQFFTAKDEVVAAERVQFEANLAVKEGLVSEAEALLPITDSGTAKRGMRAIQDRWEAAGKVPRQDLQRIEGRLHAVEQAIRDSEDRRSKRADPELNARAQSMVDQLERAVESLEIDLAHARSRGDQSAISAAEQALEARREWLDSARSGLAEFRP